MKILRVLFLSVAIFSMLPSVYPFCKSTNDREIIIDSGQVAGKVATVSFHMSNTYSPELIEVIKSGIEVKFEYLVVVERVHKNWFDSNAGDLKVEKIIIYDPISNEYSVYSSLQGKKKFFKELGRATDEFFSEKDLVIPLSSEAVRGKRYEISVRARIDEMEVAGIFRHVPFISGWFEMKTDWERLRVNAR